jgi:D-beta-D-heptose 7-phosphate kinase/D-beta-D-heptose 1-phosphate adenosyltransferase
MSSMDCDALEAIVGRWREKTVLVVGDLMLDEYRLGQVERMSPEAPVPVVRVREAPQELGGAGNVARNVVSLGASCELVGCLGRDAEGRVFRDRLRGIGIDEGGTIEVEDRATTHKLRVVAGSRQLLRLDREQGGALGREASAALLEAVEVRLPDCDVVILEDYEKGLFADGLAARIIALAGHVGRPVLADPKTELRRFRGASLVKPNWSEATQMLGRSISETTGRASVLEKLRAELAGSDIVVTRGAAGMSALGGEGGAFDVPTRPVAVFDVQGAGDTAAAALGLARAAGATLLEACIVANAAGSVAVEKVGTAAVGVEELLSRLPAALDAWACVQGDEE